MPVSSGKPHEILHQHVLLRLRSRILKQERLNDLAHEQEKILRERLPEGVVVRLHGILASAEKNGSTADCVAMAERIVAMLKEEAEKEQQRKKDEEAAKPPNDPPQADSPDVTDEDSGDESDETAPDQTEESDEDESEGEADADGDGDEDEDSTGDAGGPGDDASEENADTDAPTSQTQSSSDDTNDGEENGDASQDGSSPDQTEEPDEEEPDEEEPDEEEPDEEEPDEEEPDEEEPDEDEPDEDEPQEKSHTPDDSGDEGEEGAGDNTPALPPEPGSGASNDPRSDESMEAVEAILNNQEEAPQDLFHKVAAILETVGAGRAFSLPLEHKAEASVDTALLQKAGSESARIAAALDGLVQSERQERRTHKHQGRKLDTGKLHRTISGDTKVFLREQRREAVNTAIHVLLDLSSSMVGRETIAKEAAMALALALDRIPGVNQSLTLFPGKMVACDGTAIPSVTRMLAPREHPRRLSGPLAQCHADGGTPMTEALYYAASRLVGGQEHRKTILVITDGEPNNPVSTKKAVTEIRHMGIEICGIGIGTMVVRDLFPEHAVIRNVQELRNALFAMARRILALRAA
jgi:hypothetical protein